MMKHEQNLRNGFKINIHILKVSEEKKESESLFKEIMVENSPNVREYVDIHVQADQ